MSDRRERIGSEELRELIRRFTEEREGRDPLATPPTVADVAEALDIPEDEVHRLLQGGRQPKARGWRPYASAIGTAFVLIGALALVLVANPFAWVSPLPRPATVQTMYVPLDQPEPTGTGFQPSVPVPQGHLLAVGGLGTTWQCGSRQSPHQAPVQGAARRDLETVVRELAGFARDRALGREAVFGRYLRPPHSRVPARQALGTVILSAQYYNGAANVPLTIPQGRGRQSDALFEAELDRVVEELLRTYGHNVRRMQKHKAATGSP